MPDTPDQVTDLEFPLAGIDTSDEFARQTPGTTVAAVNVRAFEPLTGRGRGGARPGLTKYMPDPVDGVVGHEVQNLSVIVDPTVDALTATLEDWTGTGIPDPSTNNLSGTTDPDNPLTRNPGRYIRNGGSGVQPTRRSKGSGGTDPVAFRQVLGGTFGDYPFGTTDLTRTDALAFPLAVKRKSLLVAVLHTINTAGLLTTPTHTLSDSLGLSWNETPASWQGPIPAIPGHYNGALRVFWAVTAIRPGSAACTVSVESVCTKNPALPPATLVAPPVALALLEITGLEYAPGLTATMDSNQSDNTGLSNGTGVLTFSPGGSITPSRAGGVTIGVFGLGAGITSAAPFTAKPINGGVLDPTVTYDIKLDLGHQLCVTGAIGEPASTAVTPTLEADMTGHGSVVNFSWVAFAASWRKGL